MSSSSRPLLVVLVICLAAFTESAFNFKRLGNLGSNLGIVNCPVKTVSVPSSIPETFDASQNWPGCISHIRNQESCGSCWAFSSSSVLTDRFCIASNGTIKRLLSPQHLVSCEKECQRPILTTGCDAGCNGGYLDNAWKYFQKEGAVGDSCINYQATDSTCPTTCNNGQSISSTQTRFMSSECYKLNGVEQIQAEIMTNGPIQAGYNVYQDFDNYEKGVYKYDGSSPLVGGHAIRIIGWGSEGGVPYWLVANSWGTGWGEDGLFKIRRGTNECNIEDNAIAGLPEITGITNENEGYTSIEVNNSVKLSAGLASLAAILFLVIM